METWGEGGIVKKNSKEGNVMLYIYCYTSQIELFAFLKIKRLLKKKTRVMQCNIDI